MRLDAALIDALLPGGHERDRTPLHGGITYDTHRVTLTTPDGRTRSVVLRAARPPHDASSLLEREYATLRLARRLDLPVPTPLHLVRENGCAVAMLVALMPGRPAVDVADAQACARAFAAQLAQIHRRLVSAVDIAHLPPARAALQCQLQHRPERMDAQLREPLVRAALAAAGPVPAPRNGMRLLHGDFWPGNVLWHDGAISAVLDWEDALAGEPLLDVAITRLDLLWAYGPDAMRTFTAHWASQTACGLDDLPYWDLWAAMRPMGALAQWASAWPRLGRADVTAARLASRHHAFVDAALAGL